MCIYNILYDLYYVQSAGKRRVIHVLLHDLPRSVRESAFLSQPISEKVGCEDPVWAVLMPECNKVMFKRI